MYKICDKEKASSLGIDYIKDANIICIDIAYIPSNMTIKEYIAYLKDEKIIEDEVNSGGEF